MKTILVDAINAFVLKNDNGGGTIYKDMYELLETYNNPKIILTGAKKVDFEKYSLNSMPYQVFTTEHNPKKIDPEYYKTMLKECNLDVSDVIYFEHNAEAVASAESVGIRTFHWDSENKPLHNLREFLEANM